ncbi:peptide ABC transporter substrate-binding protein [Tumebacillus permanentifrigoris]|uniref:Oligopeptide transport system substrate-binding protein n=1 Tax=Tumebacillus permanentifrigoris TaxID=378543 RepID=A0A316DDC9_9BACL|nr:peptide ABC transporter substrate-binding protein [Tumebacillus permanentifrigoris]PWK13468.1 oligopeptide transport system substrate-binding protein [Tumebacillus permanentifrigoris]
MKAKSWMGVGLAVTLLSTVGLVGCGNSSTDSKSGSSDEQTLSLHLPGEPSTLDSSKTTDSTSNLVIGNVGEGLTRVDKDGKAQPGVAKEWEISQDGLTYTFHLRDNAKWSDGSNVTAQDFEYAWKRTLDPKTASQYSFMAAWIKGGQAFNTGKGSADQVAVKAKDDKTLEVVLESPRPYFLAQTAFPIFFPQKKEVVEKQGDKFGGDADKTVYNGPFKVTEWSHEQSVKLEKNENYWDQENVKLQTVTWTIVKDSSAMENLYESGQLDRFTIVRDQVERYKDKPEYSVVPELTNAYIQFNQNNKALANVKIRQALTYAVDSKQYVDVILNNGSQEANGFVPTGVSNGQGGDFRKDSGDLVNRKDNAAKAKDLLAEGLKEAGLSSFPALKLLSDDSETAKKSSEFLKEQWRQHLGIDVEIESVPSKLRFQRQQKHDFELVMSLWGADYNDPMTFLDMYTSTSPFNDVSYKNPKYDELIQSANQEPDSKKRMQYLYDAEKLLMADMVEGPIYFRSTPMVMRGYVKGWQNNMSAPTYDLKHVSIEGKN